MIGKLKCFLSSKGPLVLLGYFIVGAVIGLGIREHMRVRAELVVEREAAAVLAQRLEETEADNEILQEELGYRQEIIDSFSGQISGIASTVGTLEKLAATDPELLKKYSRVYFLNENYVPARLTNIEEEYIFGTAQNTLIHADVWPSLRRLLIAAHRDDVELLVASAFRSFGTQGALNQSYRVTYGTGANQFSAEQGYSEHQLGTTVDFTTPATGAVFNRFASDPAYEWLQNNAHRYGFTLSYPEGNTYYQYEPWHWRFVGTELATHLQREGQYFYDLDQREIDEYLVKLFD